MNTHLNRFLLSIALVVASIVTAPVFVPASVVRAENQLGYLWTLTFDFDKSLNGVLTLKVGQWQNGSLTTVEQTSNTPVVCQAVGPVNLVNGYAEFNGGSFLDCTLDLAGALKANHGMEANSIDSYGSFIMRTRAQLNAPGGAPVFSHPDASFWLNVPGPMMVQASSALTNKGGPMTSQVFSLNWGAMQTYTSHYTCQQNGPCAMTHWVATNQQTLANQGIPAHFSTAATQFTVGRGLNGRIDGLIVDPGNYGHH